MRRYRSRMTSPAQTRPDQIRAEQSGRGGHQSVMTHQRRSAGAEEQGPYHDVAIHTEHRSRATAAPPPYIHWQTGAAIAGMIGIQM